MFSLWTSLKRVSFLFRMQQGYMVLYGCHIWLLPFSFRILFHKWKEGIVLLWEIAELGNIKVWVSASVIPTCGSSLSQHINHFSSLTLFQIVFAVCTILQQSSSVRPPGFDSASLWPHLLPGKPNRLLPLTASSDYVVPVSRLPVAIWCYHSAYLPCWSWGIIVACHLEHTVQ